MAELIIWPDAQWIAIEGILDGFAAHTITCDVMSWVPRDVETAVVPPLVTVARTGGATRSVVFDDAELAVEVWGDTDAAAADLASVTRGLLHALAGTAVEGTAIYRVVDVAGPANVPDPDSGVPRYTFSVAMTLRGIHST